MIPVLPMWFDEQTFVLLDDASYEHRPLELVALIVDRVSEISNVQGARHCVLDLLLPITVVIRHIFAR